jgi:uncharacterized protein GlcG (DUF336 family)
LPSAAQLKDMLTSAKNVAGGNGGFGLNMWASVVNRKGEVCAVVFTGADPYAQWPGSRVIAAQKANTANAFSLPGLAISSANLYFPTQNGQSLFGLQLSNPVDPAAAYAGDAADYGKIAGDGASKDPLLGKKVGGINVFGGGLALYKPGALVSGAATLVGGLGVSGDSSCADHNIAWRTRRLLGLDNVPSGPNPALQLGRSTDNIIYDLGADTTKVGGIASVSGFGHPVCSLASQVIADNFASDAAWQVGSH